MIRFIDLGDQIGIPERKHFAWYDTVTDTFEEFNGNQRWETWEDFAEHYQNCPNKHPLDPEFRPLSRYHGLFPKKWP